MITNNATIPTLTNLLTDITSVVLRHILKWDLNSTSEYAGTVTSTKSSTRRGRFRCACTWQQTATTADVLAVDEVQFTTLLAKLTSSSHDTSSNIIVSTIRRMFSLPVNAIVTTSNKRTSKFTHIKTLHSSRYLPENYFNSFHNLSKTSNSI